MNYMNIGAASKESGVNAKMIRHYEETGLIPRAKRTDAGYRVYDHSDVHTLRFVKRARELGFSMKEIKKLIGLWRNRTRSSADVKKLATSHIQELEVKVRELASMITVLKELAQNCHGDERPECPILTDLSKN